MRKSDIFEIILKIIILLITILVIYWIFQLFFGGSPTLTQVNSALIIMILGFLIKIYREVGEIKVGIKHSFLNIKNDMTLIKKGLKLLSN